MRDRTYVKGDLVLIRNTRVEKEMNRKAKPRYLGPYAVVRRVKGGAYVLREMSGVILRQSIAAFRVNEYIERNYKQLRRIQEFTDIDSDPSSDPDTDPVC